MVDYLESVRRPVEHTHDVERARTVRLSTDPCFVRLRRRFIAQMSILIVVFLAWYATYLYMSVFERGIMSVQIVGPINLALLAGLGQFVSTVALSGIASSYVGRRLDPLAARMRAEAGGVNGGGDGGPSQ